MRRRLRAAAWAIRARLAVRRGLARDGLALVLPPPPALGPGEGTAVVRTLDALRATCLERALVQQAWLAGQGRLHDVVIGVRRAGEVEAHAWLDGVEDPAGHAELHRVPAARRA